MPARRLIFLQQIQAFFLWNYVTDAKYIRMVTFPDDARIYADEGKYKADKFILGERELFYLPEDVYDANSLLFSVIYSVNYLLRTYILTVIKGLNFPRTLTP